MGEAVERAALVAFMDEALAAARFADYCPNGLQVEGRASVRRVATAVTASLAAIDAALAWKADVLLVHHGWFWRGEDPRIVGAKKRRLERLLAAGCSLIAYHLPLDVHPLWGNNVQLAQRLGWSPDGTFGDHGLGLLATLGAPLGVRALAGRLARALGRPPLAVGDLSRRVQRIAWCTGAAQDMLQQAIDAGAQAFVSGEVSERTTHLAREAGVVYLAAGHHATERFGVQALGAALAERFGIEHRFFDDPNPV